MSIESSLTFKKIEASYKAIEARKAREIKYYTEDDVVMMAKILYKECRGVLGLFVIDTMLGIARH